MRRLRSYLILRTYPTSVCKEENGYPQSVLWICYLIFTYRGSIMAAYTAAVPNAYDNTLIPREVRAQYFEEVLLSSPLSMFMGDSPESVIQVLYKKNGTGSTTTFAF